MESAGSTPPEAPSLNQPAKESATDTVRPVGQSKKTYFTVVTLIGLAMGLLPAFFTAELELRVIIPYEIQSPFTAPLWLFETVNFAAFLISPCLFFVIFYLYGKRTTRHFNRNYLRVIPLMFFGSAIGYAVYIFSVPYIEGVTSVLNGTFWFGFVYGIVSEGVRDALVGFAALGLAHLRVGNLLTSLEQTLPQALKGQIPAQAAGIDLNLDGNRWMQLIKQASQR